MCFADGNAIVDGELRSAVSTTRADINMHVRLLVEYTYLLLCRKLSNKMSQSQGWPAQENSILDTDK
jgi:hypothetical protein